jgi:hypothetical protein
MAGQACERAARVSRLLVVGVLWASFHDQIAAVHAQRPGGAHRLPSVMPLAFGHSGTWVGAGLRTGNAARAPSAQAPAAPGLRQRIAVPRSRGGARGAACQYGFGGDLRGTANPWNEDPVAEAMAGSWKVEWTQDDKRRSTVVNLRADGRVAPPDDSEKTRTEKILDQQLPQPKGKAVMLFGTWRVKGEDVSIVIQRHTTSEGKKYGHATILFQGMIRNESNCPYGSKVMGNVLEVCVGLHVPTPYLHIPTPLHMATHTYL